MQTSWLCNEERRWGRMQPLVKVDHGDLEVLDVAAALSVDGAPDAATAATAVGVEVK